MRLEILDIETRDIILSRQRTTKVLIRLGRCRFFHEAANIQYGQKYPISDHPSKEGHKGIC